MKRNFKMGKGEKDATQKIYKLLDDRLLRISDEIYEESDPAESSKLSMVKIEKFFQLESAWTAYLEGLGLKRTMCSHKDWRREVSIDNCRISDPLCVSMFIDVPKELALKVLVLGYLPDSPSIKKMIQPA
jgi:hypothetical protein